MLFEKELNRVLNLIESRSDLKKQIRQASYRLIQALSTEAITSENIDRDAAKGPTERLWTGEHAQSSKFWSWLAEHGVKASHSRIPKFAEGGDGRAYFVGKHVVKFTRDRAGANISKMCIGVPDAPAPVISVWRVPGETVWAILQWKVYPEKVPQQIKLAADYLTAWLDDHPEIEAFPTDLEDQQALARTVLADLDGPMDIAPSIVLVMITHNKLYYATGFTHTDGGPTNISMRDADEGSELVYHDLGPNMVANYSPRKVLDKIHDTRKRLNLPDITEV